MRNLDSDDDEEDDNSFGDLDGATVPSASSGLSDKPINESPLATPKPPAVALQLGSPSHVDHDASSSSDSDLSDSRQTRIELRREVSSCSSSDSGGSSSSSSDMDSVSDADSSSPLNFKPRRATDSRRVHALPKNLLNVQTKQTEWEPTTSLGAQFNATAEQFDKYEEPTARLAAGRRFRMSHAQTA